MYNGTQEQQKLDENSIMTNYI